MCLGIVRSQPQCPPVAGDRFLKLPLVLERIAQVILGLGEARSQLQCPVVAGDRLHQFPLLLERIAQVILDLGEARLHLQRPAVAGDRFAQPPDTTQCDAQVVLRQGKVRPQLQCPAVAGDRFLKPPNPAQQHTPGLRFCARQSPVSARAASGEWRGDHFLQVPLIPQGAGRSCSALPAKSGFSSSFTAVAGDHFLQVPLLPSRRHPGCSAPRQEVRFQARAAAVASDRLLHSPKIAQTAAPRLICAFGQNPVSAARSPGRSRRSLLPGSPGPSTHGLRVAPAEHSAWSGLSSSRPSVAQAIASSSFPRFLNALPRLFCALA